MSNCDVTFLLLIGLVVWRNITLHYITFAIWLYVELSQRMKDNQLVIHHVQIKSATLFLTVALAFLGRFSYTGMNTAQ